MANRYAIRPDKNGHWEVYDIDSEAVVHIEGVPLIGLQDYEAMDALELLKAGLVVPGKWPKITER